jgi:triosephosphate isomerase
MKRIFVNLKRFDVPEEFGGICPMDNPDEWIEWVIDESVKNDLGILDGIEVIYILPEALLIVAQKKLNGYECTKTKGLSLASQGVFRQDTVKGGNFGAFSCNLPAAAVRNMGSSWAMIGHSEERRDKIQIMSRVSDDAEKIKAEVDKMLNEEVLCSLNRELDVVLCVGETAEEKGTGTQEEQAENVRAVLKQQLLTNLKGIENYINQAQFVIGYEPIWAIGPGKTPPGKEYISFVSSYIKEIVQEAYGFDIPVVYGGGLKEENANMIASIDSINGGLVALTTFTIPPKFEPQALKNIIDAYK